MTKVEWWACTDPKLMLASVQGRVSDRKLRLFAVSCARYLSRRYADPDDSEGDSEVIAFAERFAEGEATADEVREFRSTLGARGGYSAAWAAGNAHSSVLDGFAATAAERVLHYAGQYLTFEARERPGVGDDEWQEPASAAQVTESRGQVELLRDIVGNPFRPVALSPSWRTTPALSLARQMYDSRDFGPMPILADALEDAGCQDADILGHCRSSGPHVRGCWVVDLVLGKS